MATSYRPEKEELERVLRSGNFPRAPLQGKLLKYICEEFFAGRSDRVKEYILATEVFGRGAGFDQNQDAIVRVEAHRLRKNLREYYEGEGKNNIIHIVIEPGHYVPKFVTRELAAAVKTDTFDTSAGNDGAGGQIAEPNVKHPRPWRLLAIIAGICCIALIAGILMRWKPHSGSSEDLPTSANASGAASASATVGAEDAVRILAGYTRGDYIDRQGMRWTSDRYYSGGEAISQAHQFIARTTDNTMFEQWRRGEFSYDIPLKPGDYELHLFFVEPEFGPDAPHGGGETSRMFDVLLTGKPLLYQFDILGDVGRSETADERVFTNIHPSSDGKLHLRFLKRIDYPLVSAIELTPCLDGKMHPVRIIASDNTYTDHNGNIWLPDRYFEGGRLATDKVSIKGSPDPDLYLSQRFGYFSYSIPVAAGSKYSSTLHFTEAFFGPGNQGRGGVDSRLFDVYCNGTVLLRNFDIFKEAGGENRALVKTFHGLVPNDQGKIFFNFVPVRNYPRINAIEVSPE
ncbi:MAG TPA: malectin domain-containing carbohydrate-binding protein [Terriglobia bacterium]|nr:malectin domain-containing carbohydrate-binding protein [Terriglobia bacterium]